MNKNFFKFDVSSIKKWLFGFLLLWQLKGWHCNIRKYLGSLFDYFVINDTYSSCSKTLPIPSPLQLRSVSRWIISENYQHKRRFIALTPLECPGSKYCFKRVHHFLRLSGYLSEIELTCRDLNMLQCNQLVCTVYAGIMVYLKLTVLSWLLKDQSAA